MSATEPLPTEKIYISSKYTFIVRFVQIDAEIMRVIARTEREAILIVADRMSYPIGMLTARKETTS